MYIEQSCKGRVILCIYFNITKNIVFLPVSCVTGNRQDLFGYFRHGHLSYFSKRIEKLTQTFNTPMLLHEVKFPADRMCRPAWLYYVTKVV